MLSLSLRQLVISLLFGAASAAILDLSPSSFGDLVVHFSRDAPPTGYQLLTSLKNTPRVLGNGEDALDLQIGLVNGNLKGLEDALKDISEPGNARYGKFLTDEEVASFIAPSQSTKNALESWLSSHNLTSTPLTPAGDWVQITNLQVSKANTLLDADFQSFVHAATQSVGMRTLKYSIPSVMKAHVETVSPGGSFDFAGAVGKGPKVEAFPFGSVESPKMRKKRKSSSGTKTQSSIPASCATLVTPSCLQELYSIPTNVPKPRFGSNGLVVTAYDDEFAQKADLESLLSLLRPDIPSTTTFTLQTLDNGTNPQVPSQAGTEANLDIQISFGLVGTSVPVTFLSVGETAANTGLGAFIDTANFLIRERNGRPSVVTTSYGFNEPDLDPTTMKKLCNSYLQLGALGTSVIFSSGDGGVSGNFFTDCTDHGKFVPAFPSTCPYVTSVGGTTASSTFPNGDLETALFFGSGGFSDVFGTAWYQESQVAEYKHVLGRNYTGLFNRNGRGFPDVSAMGSNIPIIVGGQKDRAGGTSTSAPIFAAVVALLNAKLAEEGRPHLGFLNPWLYSGWVESKGGLMDVRSGSNPGCNTTGFAAVKGWDAVTGLGSPDFEGLVKTLLI